ncbi:MAG: hypothetical protein WCJ54_02520 [Actinomycetota bacterium]
MAEDTSTSTANKVVLGILVTCSLLVGASFVTNMMSVVTPINAPWICSESNESVSNFNINSVVGSSTFLATYGNIANIKYFDIYNSSNALCKKVGSINQTSNYQDKCLSDVCTGTYCKSTQVNYCLPSDLTCRLQEGFITKVTSSNPQVSNWSYKCPAGCSSGVCNRVIVSGIAMNSPWKAGTSQLVSWTGFGLSSVDIKVCPVQATTTTQLSGCLPATNGATSLSNVTSSPLFGFYDVPLGLNVLTNPVLKGIFSINSEALMVVCPSGMANDLLCGNSLFKVVTTTVTTTLAHEWVATNFSSRDSINTNIGLSNNGKYQIVGTANGTYTDGILSVSSDFGQNWSNVQTSASAAWFSVAISSDGKYMVASGRNASKNFLFTSSDFGKNWVRSNDSGSIVVFGLSATGQYQTRIGNSLELEYSSDYGITWKQSVFRFGDGVAEGIVRLDMTDNGKDQYAISFINSTGQGKFFKSTDYGQTWSYSSSSDLSGFPHYYSISSDGKYQSVIGGSEGQFLYLSNDFGLTWQKNDYFTDTFGKLAMSKDGKVLLYVNHNGGVYYSNNRGGDWVRDLVYIGSDNDGLGISRDGTRLMAGTDGKIYYRK